MILFALTLSALIFIFVFILSKKQNSYIYLTSLLLAPFPFYTLFPSKNFDVILILASLLTLFSSRTLTLHPKVKSPYKATLYVLGISILIGAIFAEQPEMAFLEIIRYVKYYIFYAILYYAIKESDNLNTIIYSLSFGILISAIIGVLQFVFMGSFVFYDITELNQNTAFSYGGDIAMRVMGTFNNSLNFAHYMSIIGPACIYWIYNKEGKTFKYFAIILAVVVSLALLFTISRGAIIAFLFVFLLLFVRRIPPAFALIIIIGSIVILSSSDLILDLLLPKAISDRFSIALEEFQESRLKLWIASFNVFLDHPVFGVGLGNLFYVGFYHYGFVDDKAAATFPGGHVENTYLSILYTLGSIGFLAFIWLLWSSVRSLWTALNKFKTQANKNFVTGLLITWMSFIINIFPNPAMIIEFRSGLILWILLAITRFLYEKSINESHLISIT